MDLPNNIQSALRFIDDDLDKLKEHPNVTFSVSFLTDAIWAYLNTHERESFDKFASNVPGEFYRGYNFDNDNDDNPNGNLERLIYTSVFSEPSADFLWA